ncbi:MAG: flagellar basal body P-ring formation chaperone FlgA [Methylophilus sp.]|nr:flagellar basal body P-ring formation chaperone FlgA [Methylophilus sp.]
MNLMQTLQRYFSLICISFALIGAAVCTAKADEVPAKVKIAIQSASTENLSGLQNKISAFLEVQTKGYPGEVSIEVGNFDPRLKLPACPDVNMFMPSGSRPWGKTNVGATCVSPKWTVYVQATVRVHAQYLVAATPLVQGQVVSERDVIFEKGDLTQFPAGVFTEVSQAVGRIVNNSMSAGMVLRQDMLKQSPVVQQGQSVTIVTVGQGFTISAEGQAISKAGEGQVVQVKVASGQVISGIARQGGKVEVMF